MMPTQTQIALLQNVANGDRVFGPESSSAEALESLQMVAEELIELNEEGFLSDCKPHHESRTGRSYVDLVMVKALTAKGRRALSAGQEQDPLGASESLTPTCPSCHNSLRATARFCDHCGFSLSSPLASTLPMASGEANKQPTTDSFVGRILQSKYQIIDEIAKGGMGRVYRARRLHVGDKVAIKILDKKYLADANAVDRFRREAKAASSIKHPNVVIIHDTGETDDAEPQAFIVMELVEGKSLKVLLQEEGKLDLARTIALMVEVCKGVSAAHKGGVVHRDIKPDNIMVAKPDDEFHERIKVLDFGLAKLRESENDPSITHV